MTTYSCGSYQMENPFSSPFLIHVKLPASGECGWKPHCLCEQNILESVKGKEEQLLQHWLAEKHRWLWLKHTWQAIICFCRMKSWACLYTTTTVYDFIMRWNDHPTWHWHVHMSGELVCACFKEPAKWTFFLIITMHVSTYTLSSWELSCRLSVFFSVWQGWDVSSGKLLTTNFFERFFYT